MGKLNIAHHKSYHPYRLDNVDRVRRDEEEARLKEEREEGRMMLAVLTCSFLLDPDFDPLSSRAIHVTASGTDLSSSRIPKRVYNCSENARRSAHLERRKRRKRRKKRRRKDSY